MYPLKPVFDLDAKVEVPDCMYRLPVIQSSQPIEGDGDQTTSDGALSALTARQDKILARLGELQQRVCEYQKSLGLPATIPSSSSRNMSAPSGRTGDLVIRCSPSHPPHSIPALVCLLQRAGLPVYTACHGHSSVANLTPSLLSFLPLTNAPRSSAQVRLTLIWTELGQDCELLVSPLIQSPIRGEANLLRYFGRLFPTLLPYESQDVNSQDQILDGVASLAWAPPKSRTPLLRQMTSRLGQASFLAGSIMGAADLALFSMVKQLKLEKDLQAEMKAWFSSVEIQTGGQSPTSPIKAGKDRRRKSSVKEVKKDKKAAA